MDTMSILKVDILINIRTKVDLAPFTQCGVCCIRNIQKVTSGLFQARSPRASCKWCIFIVLRPRTISQNSSHCGSEGISKGGQTCCNSCRQIAAKGIVAYARPMLQKDLGGSLHTLLCIPHFMRLKSWSSLVHCRSPILAKGFLKPQASSFTLLVAVGAAIKCSATRGA